MPEKPDEGNLEESGGVEPTTPSETTSQPLSGDLAATVDKILEWQKGVDGTLKALQSGKDKSVNRVLEELKPVLDIAKYLNVDEETVKQAQRDMLLDKLVAEGMASPQSEQPSPAQVENPTPTVETQNIVTDLGLSTTDPDVNRIAGEIKDPTRLAVALGKLIAERAKQPQPNPAQSAPEASSPAQPKDEAAMYKELNELYRQPSTNAARIAELEKELEIG